jgi:4-amino-4-deoxy-L-arabinose transferase-like glycosyltransferase
MSSRLIASPRARSGIARYQLLAAGSWHRLALGATLLLAALLNFWQLSKEGYGNTYYAAGVKSMLQSWHNFFFVSFDPGGFVTIDKPPLGFWIQALSAKLFGFSGVSLLLPEAIAGVLSVFVLYRLVARSWGPVAGLVATLALALTPISVVANRNNTIDSLLVLTVLLAAWAVLKAAETGRLRWLMLCAVLVGLGFNIKMLQAYLVLPAFWALYLVAARASWQTRRFWAATATEGPWLQARPLQDERRASLVLWGIWLLTCAVFFSVASFFHTYYLVMLAPAVAALSGIGTVALWQQYRESRYGWWLLPASLIAVGLIQIHILADYSAWSRWLSPLIAIVSLLAAGLVLARLWPRVDLKLTLATAVAGVAVLLAAPSAWAADSVANGSSGALPHAGPTASVRAGGIAGFLQAGLSGSGFGGTSVDPKLLSYLERHQGKTKYLLATSGAMEAAPYILRTGKPVMALGGFSGGDKILTTTGLIRLVKNGTVRYFLLSSGTPKLSAVTVDQLPKATRGQFDVTKGIGGGFFSSSSAATRWVQKSCRVVPTKEWQSRSGSSGGFAGMSQTLYDCGAAR